MDRPSAFLCIDIRRHSGKPAVSPPQICRTFQSVPNDSTVQVHGLAVDIFREIRSQEQAKIRNVVRRLEAFHGDTGGHGRPPRPWGGLGMNTIAPGLVAMLMVSIFGNKGKSEIVPNLPLLRVPILNRVPVIGQLLEGHAALFYLLFVVAVLAWTVMYRTPAGIRLRGTGTHPEVIDSLGLRSHRIQYAAVAVSGILAGIGGVYLSIGQLNFYSLDMVAGRGFISIAVSVFAKWNPIL